MRADDAIERRHHIGIAVIDRRDLGVDLGLLQIGLRVVARRGGVVERRLRNGLPLHQIGLPFEIGFGLAEVRLGGGATGTTLAKLKPAEWQVEHPLVMPAWFMVATE